MNAVFRARAHRLADLHAGLIALLQTKEREYLELAQDPKRNSHAVEGMRTELRELAGEAKLIAALLRAHTPERR